MEDRLDPLSFFLTCSSGSSEIVFPPAASPAFYVSAVIEWQRRQRDTVCCTATTPPWKVLTNGFQSHKLLIAASNAAATAKPAKPGSKVSSKQRAWRFASCDGRHEAIGESPCRNIADATLYRRCALRARAFVHDARRVSPSRLGGVLTGFRPITARGQRYYG